MTWVQIIKGENTTKHYQFNMTKLISIQVIFAIMIPQRVYIAVMPATYI